ncbi:cold-shock protein [Streptomyces sp. NPDC091377]|uniref:cold-shock protein n=1 Tax=unclassified Streptomyces TaxID=2593676 RepID=UPI0037FDD607
MATGYVVRFDSTRGYGFIAPEGGGEDIFLHVNDLLIPEDYLRSGLAVEFEVADGDRGQRASHIRLPEGAEVPVVPAVARGGAPAQGRVAPAVTGIPGRSASAGTSPVGRSPDGRAADDAMTADGEYPVCDVLTGEEFTRDITELLLKAGPGLTAAQILQLRDELKKFSESHGWIED